MTVKSGIAIPAAFAVLSLFATSACTPKAGNDGAHDVVAEGDQMIAAIYRSAKRVSSDCGVVADADPPPGFAVIPGAETKKMPERIAASMAVGADRVQVETDQGRVSPGYMLVEPGSSTKSFLINNQKEIVTTFENRYRGSFSQLLPNGNRLVSSVARTEVFIDGGGYRGCISEYLPNGDLFWRMSLNTDGYIHHHDVVKLENGNVLAVVWENVAAAEAVSQGRNPEIVAENGQFWYDGVIEVNPFTLEIVWEWSARHHMIQDFDPGKPNYGVVADHPGRLDINAYKLDPRNGTVDEDWTHVNALDYNAEFDQILLSSNYLSEFWIIDHSTTPRESAGHSGGRYEKGGDFLYRWGNPQIYDRGGAEDRTLFHQHDVQWIRSGLPGAGNILIFNNGAAKLRPYSTVIELTAPMNADGSYALDGAGSFGPESLVWEYNPEPPDRFFSFFISGAQRLANGNTLVNQGAGARMREVTTDGEIVWDYAAPADSDAPDMLFRANRYPADHPGVLGLINTSN